MKNLLIIVLLITGLCTSALAQEKLLSPENVSDVHVHISTLFKTSAKI